MENNENQISESTVAVQVSPDVTPNTSNNDKNIKIRVRKLYNSASLTLLIQFGITMAVSGIISGIYSMVLTVQTLMQNPDISPESLIEDILYSSLTPQFLLITTAISYLVANLVSYFIGNKITKRHHSAKIFGKIKLKPFDCILAVFSVIGIQMVSLVIQSIITSITGMTGIDEETASMMTISDNVLQNVVMVIYMVVIAGITEELLCRGLVMRALSVKSITFGLIASSLIFGIMHGNLNQMFNGFLLGMIFGYIALKSRTVILPMILHMLANGHALLLSFLEYKFGEGIIAIEAIYIILMANLGIGALVWLVIRNGLPNNSTDGYEVTYTIDGLAQIETNKGLTWKTLFKSAAFWIFVAFYALMAISGLTSVS